METVASLPGSIRDAARDLGFGSLAPVDRQAALLVEQAGLRYVPRRTGALAASGTVRNATITYLRPYALPVYGGWRRGTTTVAGRPWLDRGAEAATEKVLDLYEDHANDALRKVN